MKISIKSLFLPLPLLGAMIFFSCGGNNENDISETDTLSIVDPKNNTSMNQEMIGIPAPSDMLGFIRMTTAGDLNKSTSFLNTVANLKNYRDAKSMALNFGIYSCDLSYCSIFNNGTAAQEYFKAVKTLGQEIGVSSVITPEMMKRAEVNINFPDSLAAIADELYFSTSEILERNGKGPNLALVIAGGYIESLNIASNLIKFDPNSPAVSRFADQKYTLESVILYMKKFEKDANVMDCIKQMEELNTAFQQIKETKVETKTDNNKGNKKVFGGGTVLEINKEQFTNISSKIKDIRDSFTSTK